MRAPLHTERLVIRPFVLDDEEAASALWLATFGTALVRQRLTWLALTPGQLEDLHQPPIGDRALVRRDDGTLVGIVGLTYARGPYSLLEHRPEPGTPIQWTLEIGLFWALHPDHRGQGYATEAGRRMAQLAADDARTPRVIAHTTHDNLASRRVMERLGMTVQTFHEVSDAPWFQVVGALRTAHG
ncbi:MAG: GNAT family N-acetyltransferase [Myxococcota bacterium]